MTIDAIERVHRPPGPVRDGEAAPVRHLGHWLASRRVFRSRVPLRQRPALYLESLYNIGSGSFVALFLLSTVALKTILDGRDEHLALLAAFFGGSSLLSPLVSYMGRRVPMRRMVIYPNLMVAGLLLTVAVPGVAAWTFTGIVGAAFVLRVFPRVAEMNMYRVNYSPSHRGAAVGWLKAVSAVAALGTILLGYWWFGVSKSTYWLLYVLVGLLLAACTLAYARIPVSRRNVFARDDALRPHQAFWQGLRIFLADRRFLLYQFGYALAGSANHMAMVFVADILKEEIHASDAMIGLVAAVIPSGLMMASAPVWGRFLDRTNPMLARALFNTLQCAAFVFQGYGGLTLQAWPFVVGATLQAIGNGGGVINWLTGSLYFARVENVSVYNAVHVCLTGIRGLLAPIVGFLIYSSTYGLGLGAGVFWVAAGLSLLGAVVMLAQGLTDPGPADSLPN